MDPVRLLIFLCVFPVKESTEDLILSTTPDSATVGLSLSFICKGNTPSVRLNKSGGRYCIGKRFLNGSCSLEACSPDISYTCSSNTHTFILSGTAVTGSLHETKWVCDDIFGIEKTSTPVELFVYVPLTSMNIFPDTAPVDVERNKIRQFSCIASSIPLTDIQWKKEKNEQNFENLTTAYEEQVNVTTVKSYLNYTGKDSDEGDSIFCIGQYNGTQRQSEKMRVQIIYAPDTQPIIHQQPVGIITSGDNLTLTCTVAGGKPLPVLSWNCPGITTNKTVIKEASYGVSFIVDKNDNNKICTCSVFKHPVLSYRPSVEYLVVVFYPPDEVPMIQQNPNTDIFAGNNVTLTCRVSGGNPLATLSWNCNGTSENNTIGMTASYSVTFTVNKMYNNKTCTCSATHVISTYKSNVGYTLVVYYAPDEYPRIKRIPDKNLTVGDNVTLTCIVTGGNPLAILSWNCTGTKATNTSGNTVSHSVAFTVDKTYNMMVCTCSASHSVYSYKPNVKYEFVIYFGPGEPTVDFTPIMPWFEGNSTRLFCRYEEGNPNATIRWRRGNNSEEANNDNPIFEFDRLTRDDNTMEITCTVYNSYSEELSKIIHLDVQYVPYIMVEKTYILTNESKSISLSCNASGNPVPFVKWTKITRKVLNLPTANESSLYIENINRTDSGNYTCEAKSTSTKYGNLMSRKNTLVIVNFAPDVIVTKNVSNITENINLTLTCHAAGKPSKYAYGWKHTFAGDVIRLFNSNTKTLLLKNLSYQDIGKYECVVNNGIADRHGILNQTNNTNIEVQFKPVFVRYDKVTTGKADRNVSISADFISIPNIDKTLKWRNSTDNSILVNNSNTFMTLERKCVYTKIYNISVAFNENGYRSSLHFPNFDENQDGMFNLEVGNIIGVNNLTMRLVFSDRPEPPKLFSASVIGSTVVTLTWKEGFNGGNTQTFIITYWKMNSDYKKSVNVSERSDKTYEAEISDLIPSTSYVFHIIAKNEEGYSDPVNNTIGLSTKDILDAASSVIGPVAGAVGGIVAAGLFVLGIIIFRRKILASRKKTDRKKITFASTVEDDEDGLKDNELYVSAGENFTESSANTGDVYAVIRKPNDTKAKDTHIQETGLYAEVQKEKDDEKNKDVSMNAKKKRTAKPTTKGKLEKENGRNNDVYENISEQTTTNTPEKRNKDGLLYADLVFKDDGKRKFIIRGIENKTQYTDIDFHLKADPLPSDESDDEKEKVAKNVDMKKEKQI